MDGNFALLNSPSRRETMLSILVVNLSGKNLAMICKGKKHSVVAGNLYSDLTDPPVASINCLIWLFLKYLLLVWTFVFWK